MESATGQAALMLRRTMRAGRSIAEIRRHLFMTFDSADLDGGGIGPSDRQLLEAQSAAALRVRELSRYLAHDLDGDAAVAMSELRRSPI